MKELIRNNYIEVSLFKGIAFGAVKADDNYALMILCVVIEIKPYNIFRMGKKTPNTF